MSYVQKPVTLGGGMTMGILVRFFFAALNSLFFPRRYTAFDSAGLRLGNKSSHHSS
jgi:hypothetical protein